jgi:hypothetical protein
MSVSLVKDQDWHEIYGEWFGFAARYGAYADACGEFAELMADRGTRTMNYSAAGALVHSINARIIAERA